MQFLFPALAWGFALVLIPIAIHLINLIRQRRVDWAAMEFVLQAHRKHRRWIWWKQFLLLASRMLAIAAMVAMLAQLLTTRQWLRIFQGRAVHHLVLLDDSFSMSDRYQGEAFSRALQAVQAIARMANQEQVPQRMTVLRFSKAQSEAEMAQGSAEQTVQPAMQEGQDSETGGEADLRSVTIDSRISELLTDRLSAVRTSQFAVGPEAALWWATQWVAASPEDQFVVHILSDFRRDPWEQPKEVLAGIEKLEAAGATVRLVRCVDATHPNLAVTDLRPAAGIRAAGVPLFMEATVRNGGAEPAKQITLDLRTIEFPAPTAADAPAASAPNVVQLPSIVIDELAPGAAETRRFQAYFPRPGQHAVEALLPDDAVAVDNPRQAVVDFPDGNPVLVVEGGDDRRNANYLSKVFQPGERVETGVRPEIKAPDFLRDATASELNRYRVLYLLDVPRLDPRAWRNLGQFVERGGGLAFFLGPNVNFASYNAQANAGTRLFPLTLNRVDRLGPAPDDTPDVVVEDHPLLKVFSGDRNRFLADLRVSQYVRGSIVAAAEQGSEARVLARVRSGHPYIVEHRFGAGRIVVCCGTLAPTWNNWATKPAFVVWLLELQAHLDSQEDVAEGHLVGEPLAIELPADSVLPEGELLAEQWTGPRLATGIAGAGSTATSEKAADATTPSARRISLTGKSISQPPPTRRRFELVSRPAMRQHAWLGESGLFSLRVTHPDGKRDVHRFGIQIDPRDSDLIVADPTQLARNLARTKVQILSVSALEGSNPSATGFAWNQVLLYALVAILLGEQLLAYSASYHLASRSTP